MSKPTEAPKDGPMVQRAKMFGETGVNRIEEQHDIAVKLMPAFRDKFDFSKPEDYDKLADMAYLAASAVLNRRKEMLSEHSKNTNRNVEEAMQTDFKNSQKESP